MVTPSPDQGAARRQLGMLRTDELPMLAAHWLTELDSPALRRLAGLSGTEGWLIDQLWAQALADVDVQGSSLESIWDLAIAFQIASWRAGERSLQQVMAQVIHAYIDNDYPPYVPEAGHLYGLDDELKGGWGRATNYVLADAEQTLRNWALRRGLAI